MIAFDICTALNSLTFHKDFSNMLKKVPLIPSPCGDPMFDGKGSDNLPFILMLIVVLLKSTL